MYGRDPADKSSSMLIKQIRLKAFNEASHGRYESVVITCLLSGSFSLKTRLGAVQ